MKVILWQSFEPQNRKYYQQGECWSVKRKGLREEDTMDKDF